MSNHVANRVRLVFVALVLTLLAYTGLDAALAHGRGHEREASACGSAANPCRLAPLVVTRPGPAHLAGVAVRGPAPLAHS
ncbi:MAG TPA: hypothetical protein VF746_21850 [Longimicrobium sp.]|jgi:hypothetical protein